MIPGVNSESRKTSPDLGMNWPPYHEDFVIKTSDAKIVNIFNDSNVRFSKLGGPFTV